MLGTDTPDRTEVCAWWVPTHLTELHIDQCSKVTFAHIPWFREERNKVPDSTMAGHFTSQTEQDGMQWKNQIL
jgi:hypothetical protein